MMSVTRKLFVIKRNGQRQDVIFDKIKNRISSLCYDLDTEFIDVSVIAVKVIQGLYAGVSTVELDTLAAEISASMMTTHPDYGILAARITVSNLHKETPKSFSTAMRLLYNNTDTLTGKHEPLISLHHYHIIDTHKEKLDAAIVSERDYSYDYFGIKTLEKSYLLSINGKIVERPQYMLMRVAVGIHGNDMDNILETYTYLSRQYFIHATPTLFSAATPIAQLSSCYLLTIKGDSIERIFETVSDCAAISKTAGGIGLNIHDIRARGTKISGTGSSNGVVPMLRVFNNVARYVDQGGGKRMGSFAIYLEPWHADIFDFLELKKNHGLEENRARDLFYGLWVPDLFMNRVKADKEWSLMCPHQSPGLADVWGEDFETLYMRYESKKMYVRQVNARQLWHSIIESQVETGTPYIMYKDACNRKSNQRNLGTIKCSNLCTEIIEYSSPDEIAVCNLASIALPKFVKDDGGGFDFEKLRSIAAILTKNLNKIIDINHYPVREARLSNLRHRPIGIGVQGLADTFCLLRYPYDSEEARLLNRQIFETIYFGALEESCEQARLHGAYSSYHDSPVSCGILQFDMWNCEPSEIWNWDELRVKISKYGVRNSLLIAPMPTASTAQIMGNSESFEPITTNIYVRRVLSGEFNVVNRYLVKDLIDLNLWTDEIRNKIIAERGSVQKIEEIPINIRQLYKTVWEISGRSLIDMAADRGAFIDQSQSFSLYVDEPSYAKLSSIHFYGWERGLKTGMYYLRTKAAANAIQFTVVQGDKSTCTREDNSCLSCSS